MEPLVTSSWLKERLSDPDVQIVDVRWYLADPNQGRQEYLAAHIDGSVYLDVETDLSAPSGRGRHPLPSPVEFAMTLGSAGVRNDSTVIAYDSSGGAVAARLWWMLRHVGHDAVAVLDGGWQGWLAADGPVSGGTTVIEPCRFVARPRRGDSIDREDLHARLGDVRLIDARAAERYEGRHEPVDPAAGHIPTAVSFPFAGNLDSIGRFRDPEALRQRYGTIEGPTVAYCGSGVTACHTVLAHVVAGLPEPILYGGSWSDWASAGLPVAVGPEPGGKIEPNSNGD